MFVDEKGVAAREAAIGKGGILPGADLASTFNALRANDLVWPYVVNNYLQGGTPAAFDILYWNADSTNLPGPMYCSYVRNTYLENKLRVPGAVRNCGVPVDLGRVDRPTFILATREDHIVPWRAAYRSLGLLGGEKQFVLGASGHIAGVINPPAGGKRSYWHSGNASGASGRLARAGARGARQLVAAVVAVAGPVQGRQGRQDPSGAGTDRQCGISGDRTCPRSLRKTEGSVLNQEITMEDIVIVGAARTAIGKFGGTLAGVPAARLGAHIIRKVLERAGVTPDQVSEVIMGQVLTAGVGQNPARQAAIWAGLPDMVPAMTINKVCGSGLKAAMLGAQAIANGDSDIVIAGGQENMSAAPHVLNGSRDGFRMGDAKLIDSMIVDGLWDVYNQYHMGVTAENVAKEYGVTREEQDEFAVDEPEQGRGGAEGRPVQGRDRSVRGALAQGARGVRRRRVSAPRRDRGSA